MSVLQISIGSEALAHAFTSVLAKASYIASDMIEVRTAICEGAMVKTVRTECPSAFALISAFEGRGVGHE